MFFSHLPLSSLLAFDLVFPPVLVSSIPYGKVDTEDLSRKPRLVYTFDEHVIITASK